MRRIIAALAGVALLASSVPAHAGGYGSKHRGAYSMSGKHYGYGGHYGHKRKHHYYGFYALGALAGAIVIGSLLSRPRYAYSTPTYAYRSPQPKLGNCVRTTGTRVEYGKLAEYGGTMCYDRYNRPHVLENSVRFIRYPN